MKKLNKYLLGLALLTCCNCNNPGKKLDTQTSGTINISVDDSYEPLIDTEIRVFEGLYPEAHLVAHYKPESECFRDLVNDSSRLIIVTRQLNSQEQAYFKGIRMPINSKILAWDAVALIVNPADPDTNMTMDDVRAIMGGTYTKKKYEIVFDNPDSAGMSGVVRYVIDSINKGKPLPPNARAAKNSEEVVNYVAQNKDALGVIGVSWISDPNDSTGLSFLQKIRVVAVKGDASEYYNKPYQSYIALKSYPLTRAFYFVLREPYFGLGTGFANFLGGNQGQLIIGKYRLFPARLNIVFREATIN